jgi:hypothetical protein
MSNLGTSSERTSKYQRRRHQFEASLHVPGSCYHAKAADPQIDQLVMLDLCSGGRRCTVEEKRGAGQLLSLHLQGSTYPGFDGN